MIATRVYRGGEEFIALFAEPNTEASPRVEVEESGSTDIESTRHAREVRRPNCAATVISKVGYTAGVEGDDWQAWRGIQALVGSRRVVVPIWPDVAHAAEYNPVHVSDLVIGFDDGYARAKLGTSTDLPDRQFLAPVCVGKLALNNDQPLTNVAAEVKVEVAYDAAFGQTITGEIFTFDGTTDTSTIRYSMQGDHAFDAAASYVIGETTKGVATPNQAEPVTTTMYFGVAETTIGSSLADQAEILDIEMSFIVEETLQ